MESPEKIIIEKLTADEDEGVFVVNDEFWIKFTSTEEQYSEGDIQADVEYNDKLYTTEQIQTLITDLFEKIITEYIDKGDSWH